MPPTSTNIFEEGAHIVSFKIVREGLFDQEGLYDYMIKQPAQYPGSSGCRNIRDVESDLKAVRPLIIHKYTRGLAVDSLANRRQSQRCSTHSS